MRTISEKLEKAVELIESHFQNWTTPSFFVQFGTGFAADLLFDEEPQSLELSKLPNMPDYHNPDFEHPSLLYGLCMGVPVLALRGHRHLYEGLGTYPCVFPICTAWKLGIRRHVFIEGALSLRTELKPGTWTLLTDYINGHGVSPLDGLHHLLNTPFPDMMDALSQHQNSEFVNAFAERGIDPRLCVYMSRPGSQFCTVAEAEASRQSGADIRLRACRGIRANRHVATVASTQHLGQLQLLFVRIHAGLPPRLAGDRPPGGGRQIARPPVVRRGGHPVQRLPPSFRQAPQIEAPEKAGVISLDD